MFGGVSIGYFYTNQITFKMENKLEKKFYNSLEFDYDCLLIKQEIDLEEIKYDCIIAPYRGGLPLGVKLSHILDLPLGVIEFQRLDGRNKNPIRNLSIEPVGKDGFSFWTHKKILLVDDICDTGITIEKIYKYLKSIKPNCEIVIITLFGSNDSREHLEKNIKNFDSINFKYLNDCSSKWVVFPWENETGNGNCNNCNFGEPCNKNLLTHIHCNNLNKSFMLNHSCDAFKFKFKEKKFYKKE